MACEDVPTLGEIQTLKLDAATINEVVTSSNHDTPPASDGETKLTLAGIEQDADAAIASASQTIVDATADVVSDAGQAQTNIAANEAAVQSASDQALIDIEDGVDAANEFVESSDPTFTTPIGQTKYTVSGVVDFGLDAFAAVTGQMVGLYNTDPALTTLNEYTNDGTTNYKAKSATSLPYTIDSATYPNPADDPSLEAFADINSGNIHQYTDPLQAGIDALDVKVDSKPNDNILINGALEIDQRGGTVTTADYGVDRWTYLLNGGASVSRQQFPSGAYYLAGSTGGIGNLVTISQKLESPIQYNLETLTLSFFVFGGYLAANDFNSSIYLNHAGGTELISTQINSTGTSGGTEITFTFDVGDISAFTLDSDSNLEIRVFEVFSSAVDDSFGLSTIKLERGLVATPFVRSSGTFAGELAACQRYYWKGTIEGDGFGYQYGAAGNDLMNAGGRTFPTAMRVPPTMTMEEEPSYTNCSGAAIQSDSFGDGFILRVLVGASGRFRASEAVISADAEL